MASVHMSRRLDWRFRCPQWVAGGVFIGEHGSWNRSVPAGYKVVFVPFRDGRPAGDPIDFAVGFLDDEGNARARPVGVTVDPRGALIIADDLSNTTWRVTAK
jgi:glucose/arabinose dehydrogenase